MNHADLKATHTFGDDTRLRPTTSQMSPSFEDNTFAYTFPAHSLTLLRVQVR